MKRRDREMYGRSHQQRAKRLGVERTYFNERKVLERDRWRCGLCGRATPERLRGTFDPRAPELDHIVPLAAGGTHVVSNVQCSCRACNLAKGSRPLGQMLLAI